MGIVIINGKRYDSITGLSVDSSADKNKVEIDKKPAAAEDNTLPSWINEYVQERKEEHQLDSTSNAMGEPVYHAVSMRRHASPSRTLDQRFIAPAKPATTKIAANEVAVKHAPVDTPKTAAEPARAVNSIDNVITVKHAQKESASANNTSIWSIRPDTSEAETSPEAEQLYEDSIARLSAILENASELNDSKSNKKHVSKAKRNRNAKKEKAETRSDGKARKFSPRAIFATAGAVAVVVALGVYIALPSISVRMAAADAGIDAHNPYAPKGYTINGKIAASKGKVKISYRNTSGSDGYSITQEKSNLSDSGLHNEVISETTDYDSYQQIKAGDKNIYLTGNTATWVKGGIKYTVDGNDFLDTDEITNIANSL